MVSTHGEYIFSLKNRRLHRRQDTSPSILGAQAVSPMDATRVSAKVRKNNLGEIIEAGPCPNNLTFPIWHSFECHRNQSENPGA